MDATLGDPGYGSRYVLQMMTPVEQLRNPRETESSFASVIANASYEAATVTADGSPSPSLLAHNRVCIQLRTNGVANTTKDDLFLLLTGWDTISGPHDWGRPHLIAKLTHEWTFGQSDERDLGVCRWEISDQGAGFQATGSMMIWDTYQTKFPGWFWCDGNRPPLQSKRT
jgi:hypothetical protein